MKYTMSNAHSTASPSTLNMAIAPIVEPIADIPMDVDVGLNDKIKQIKKAAQLEEKQAAEAAEKPQQAVWDAKATQEKHQVDQQKEQEEKDRLEVERVAKEKAQVEVEESAARASIVAVSIPFLQFRNVN